MLASIIKEKRKRKICVILSCILGKPRSDFLSESPKSRLVAKPLRLPLYSPPFIKENLKKACFGKKEANQKVFKLRLRRFLWQLGDSRRRKSTHSFLSVD
jgi:hypothetical protein